ncbi:hypothetical protein [Agrilutibacter solisilvae]|uniref:SH3 domain-containing protein n=1 Tax=Agrilutibacter solisilvae TaxID=2763317 RepID=A0A975ATR3_9GAMM|nr:hypothetical protein [Lysobacter solisilvae]QSX79389.1 hypothetical protein I8J32_005875 [Lysobacter solisilvae]
MTRSKIIFALALASATVLGVFAFGAAEQKVAQPVPASPAPFPCERVGPDFTLGSGRTIEEAEEEESVVIADSGGIRSVPFGHANEDWLKLRASLHSGDVLHSFERGSSYGGYLALRSGCVVGQLTLWVS